MTLYASTASGIRSRLLPSPARLTRSAAQTHSIDLDNSGSSSDNQSTPPPTSRRIRGGRLAISKDASQDNTLSDQQNIDAADASNEDDENEDDPPALFAPSHAHNELEAGRFLMDLPEYNPQNTLPWTLDDDDDDDSYEAVNDIPDDDEDADEIDPAILAEIQAALRADENSLFHVDGLSDFGFEMSDIEYDDQWPSTSEDGEDMHGIIPQPQSSHDRHIHFEDLTSASHMLTKDVSPLLTRTLLPSLITDIPPLETTKAVQIGKISAEASQPEEDSYDSDATVEDPRPRSFFRIAAAQHMPSNGTSFHPTVSTSTQGKRKRTDDEEAEQVTTGQRKKIKATSKRRRAKAPPRGVFDTNPQKPWATLDASGKKLIIYPNSGADRPNWLAKAMDSVDGVQSTAASPRDLLDEISEGGSTPKLGNVDLDDPQLDLETILGLLQPQVWLSEGGDGQMNIEDPDFSDPENEADLANFIDSEYYSSDEDLEMIPSSSFSQSDGNHVDEIPHLNNSNVTSFRRRLDPTFDPLYENPIMQGSPASAVARANARIASLAQRELSSITSTSLASDSALASPIHSSIQTPRLARAHRRNTSNSPFSTPRYNNVSPLPRVLRTLPKRNTTVMT